ILVQADGTFRLVDYDGMFVPGMRQHGLASSEAGVAAYQHPPRRGGGGRFDGRTGDFIGRGVLVKFAGGGYALLEQYHDEDHLLLKESDLLAPTESPLLTALNGRSGQVGKLAAIVQNAAGFDVDQLPSFGRIAGDLGMEWLTPVTAEPMPASPVST